MRNILITSLLLGFILFCHRPETAVANQGDEETIHAVGVRQIRFTDKSRKRKLSGRIWYPAPAGTKQRKVIYNNIFLGQHAKKKAEMISAPERLPMLLVSHGSGGNHANLAWLAEVLAAHGYIVAAFDHPGDQYGDQNPEGIIKKWERPQDLSFLVGKLMEDPMYAPRIDPDRIGLIGHSSGGYAAAALAGGIYDIDRLSEYCRTLNYSGDCSLVTAEQVARVDPTGSDLSYQDGRFRVFVAFVPAVGQGFSGEGLAPIDRPFLIFGSRDDEIASFDNNAAHYAKLIKNAQFEILERGGHFVYFSHCNEMGTQNAANVCVDAEGIDREQIHQDVQRKILDFLGRHL